MDRFCCNKIIRISYYLASSVRALTKEVRMEIEWTLVTSAIATIGSLLMLTTKKLEGRALVGIWLLFAAFVIQATVICYYRWGVRASPGCLYLQ